ncbi:MAG TPA: hypothetical protein VL985_11865 [Stellaceae bacterium]|nr:hypothetical protein [Stellaceae bacterium]
MDIDVSQIAYVPTTGVRRVHQTPLIVASNASLDGYGCLVEDPASCPIEIVRWPAQGWRPVDANSGDQGGTVEASSNFPGRARRFTHATMRSATPICSLGAIGRRRRLPTGLSGRASGR